MPDTHLPILVELQQNGVIRDVTAESFTLIVDNTSLTDFSMCPMSYYYARVRRRVLARPRTALQFGGAIHQALAYRYRKDPHLDLPGTQDAMFSAFTTSWEEEEHDVEDYRNLDYGYEVITRYNKKYPDEHPDVPIPETVESSFLVFLGSFPTLFNKECRVLYTGKIDMMYRRPDGGLWVRDHKTSSVFGETFFAEMAVTPQMEGYMFAAREATGETPVGYEVNAIATRRPTRTGAGVECERQPVYVSTERLEEWRENTLLLCKEMMYYTYLGTLPQRKKWCVGKYGKCPYYEVCSLPREQRETMLATNLFKADLWSPLNPVTE